MQRERCSRTMWQMRDCQRRGYPAMFVEEKQVRQGRGIGAGNEVGQNEGTSVETNGGGK